MSGLAVTAARPGAARRLWLLVAVLMFGTLGAVTPSPAFAHGGYQMIAVTKGPYSVVVRARPYLDGGRSKVDVTAYVVRQDIGESDLGARLRLRLAGPDGSLTLEPKVVGDGYESVVNAAPNAWRHWTVTARVVGAAGSTTVTGGPVGDPPGAPGWLIPASVLVALTAVALFITGRRRRATTPEQTEDDPW